MNTRKRFMIIN